MKKLAKTENAEIWFWNKKFFEMKHITIFFIFQLQT